MSIDHLRCSYSRILLQRSSAISLTRVESLEWYEPRVSSSSRMSVRPACFLTVMIYLVGYRNCRAFLMN